MAFRPAAAMALLLALCGCREDAELTIVKSGAGPIALEVDAHRSDFRACIDRASIYPARRPDQPAWELGRTDPRRCVQRVAVGPALAGFAQRSSGSIAIDGRYCAEINGPGFGVRRGFELRQSMLEPDKAGGGAC